MAVGEKFSIALEFGEGMTPGARELVSAAAARWSRVITDGLPRVEFDGLSISDLLIRVSSKPIDKPGGVLAHGSATHLRPESAGSAAYLPALGEIIFDAYDLPQMEQTGTLELRALHEMGHVLGFDAQVFGRKHLVAGIGQDPVFNGNSAMREYGRMLEKGPIYVPLEDRGGDAVSIIHWREAVFGDELMTSQATGIEPLSRLTIAALVDMGYATSPAAADPYALPEPPGFIARTLNYFRAAPALTPHLVSPAAIVLPDSALRP